MKHLLITYFIFIISGSFAYAQNTTYPLGQTPALGEKEFTVIIASFGNYPIPPETVSRVEASVRVFNEYSQRLSGNKIKVNSIISPVLQISDEDSENAKDDREKKKLMREYAERAGLNTEVSYLGYVIISEDKKGFGGVGGGNGTNGEITMGGTNLWIPGVVHEMMHMFSLGHAHIVEGGDEVFPGTTQGGRDPYFFMGSEGDNKDCPTGTNDCDIFAQISLPQKGRLAWIDENEYFVSKNDGATKTFKIFNHDNNERTSKVKLGVFLKSFNDEGVFILSYLKVKDLDNRQRLSKVGLMLHYVPKRSPAISEILDLTPNSITSNTERASDESYTDMHDAGDGTLHKGESIDVSDLFNIEVLEETTEAGDNNYSVEFKITPLGCKAVDIDLSIDHFDYTEVGINEKCENSFSNIWNLNETSEDIAIIDDNSLTYESIVDNGKSLRIPADNSTATRRNPDFVMERDLYKTFRNGDDMWLSYLLKANQVDVGHFFVRPNRNIHFGIGKNYSNSFSVNNTVTKNRPLVDGETVLVVAKYELRGNNEDNVYMWINPEIGDTDPDKSDAVSFKENETIGSIGSIDIEMRSKGDYNIDRFVVTDSYEKIFEDNSEFTLSVNDVNLKSSLKSKPYPNPFKNELFLGAEEASQINVTLYNSLGMKLQNYTDYSDKKINTSTLQNGIYFLRLENEKKRTTEIFKIIKN